MPTGSLLRRIVEVERCPRCGGSHRFQVALRSSAPAAAAVPLFGGGRAASGDADAQEVGLTCPTTGMLFTRGVPSPPDAEVVEVVEAPEGAAELPPAVEVQGALPAAAPGSGVLEEEYAAWVQGSRAVATEFCQLMLNSSVGAIPVYFAVLGFLGMESVEGSPLARVAVVPPVVFLAAGLLFVFALRPQFAAVAPEAFAAYRTGRLRRMNLYIVAGVALFTAGAALAILLFFRALG